MKKLLVTQPVLTDYRIPEFKKIAAHFNMLLLSSMAKNNSGFSGRQIDEKTFNNIITKTFSLAGKLFYQKRSLELVRSFQPDIVLACATTRDISFWMLLVYCYFHNIPLYSWGHGPFKNGKNLITKVLYYFILGLSKMYITYNLSSYNSFKLLGINTSKVCIAENSIHNSYSCSYDLKKFDNKGILFIGRLREGCNLELLIDAVLELKNTYSDIMCHIIGEGNLSNFYKDKYKGCSEVSWHGEIYDQEIISVISRECIIGCYPGNTGLSVVHYMSLALPVVIHNDTHSHGPEASYVIDNYNGKTFQKKSAISLKETINNLFSDLDTIKKLSANAALTYSKLNKPGLADRIINILDA